MAINPRLMTYITAVGAVISGLGLIAGPEAMGWGLIGFGVFLIIDLLDS